MNIQKIQEMENKCHDFMNEIAKEINEKRKTMKIGLFSIDSERLYKHNQQVLVLDEARKRMVDAFLWLERCVRIGEINETTMCLENITQKLNKANDVEQIAIDYITNKNRSFKTSIYDEYKKAFDLAGINQHQRTILISNIQAETVFINKNYYNKLLDRAFADNELKMAKHWLQNKFNPSLKQRIISLSKLLTTVARDLEFRYA